MRRETVGAALYPVEDSVVVAVEVYVVGMAVTVPVCVAFCGIREAVIVAVWIDKVGHSVSIGICGGFD
jgi:hypothetical protein